MPERWDVEEMPRAGMTDARRAWLGAARHDSDQDAHREKSDFLADMNHEGEVLDSHSLRHTCGAWQATAGAHPKEVQSVMRHSSVTLTMETYGHLFPGQEADTGARFSGMLTDAFDVVQATGTGDPTADPASEQHACQQSGRDLVPIDAMRCDDGTGVSDPTDRRNPLRFAGDSETVRHGAKADENAPRRTRTCNPLIKSQLLCQIELGRRGGTSIAPNSRRVKSKRCSSLTMSQRHADQPTLGGRLGVWP